MTQIARLRNAEIADGNLINADDISAELDQLVSESNSQDTALTAIATGAYTFSGVKTFASAPKTNQIDERTAGSGVTIDSVRCKDGMVKLAGTPTVAGEIGYAANVISFHNGTGVKTLLTDDNILANAKGHLFGLTLSNNTSTPNTDLDIAAGQCMDDTNTDLLVYAGGTKRLSSSWAVGTGNGSGETGTIPVSGTTHVFIIKRVDTGVVDVFTSTSLSPTLPSGYTLKRRIGSVLSDASSHLLAFIQVGDRFDLQTPILDVNVSNQGTSAVTRTLSVPTGFKLHALLNVVFANGSASQAMLVIRNPYMTDIAPSNSAAPLATFITENNSATADYSGGQISVLTNDSSQITTRASTTSLILRIATIGWVDNRGKDA